MYNPHSIYTDGKTIKMLKSLTNIVKQACAPVAMAALSLSPFLQADADVIVNATGVVTVSTQVVPGTIFEFTAIVDEDTPDALPEFKSIGSFQNAFEEFSLTIGQGPNAVVIEGAAGGSVVVGTDAGLGSLQILDVEVDNVTGLPPEFTFESFIVNFDSVVSDSDGLLDGLNAFANNSNGVFDAGLSPTSASGTISSFSVTNTSVPEPSSLALLVLGAAGTVVKRRKRELK